LSAVVKLEFRHILDDHGLTVLISGLRVVSEANVHQHWHDKQPRKVAQRLIVREAMQSAKPYDFREGDLKVVFTRIYRGKRMDTDNLANGLKAIRDSFFKCIGRDDGEERIEIVNAQEPGPSNAVQISVDRQ
jgi:hypothetical protein